MTISISYIAFQTVSRETEKLKRQTRLTWRGSERELIFSSGRDALMKYITNSMTWQQIFKLLLRQSCAASTDVSTSNIYQCVYPYSEIKESSPSKSGKQRAAELFVITCIICLWNNKHRRNIRNGFLDINIQRLWLNTVMNGHFFGGSRIGWYKAWT